MNASIVIPTYNSAGTVGDLLKKIEPQNPGEVIFVDDGSSDDTLKVLHRLQENSGLNLKIISQDHLGPASARNSGAKNASCDIVIFLDSDCIPSDNWLFEMTSPFSDPEVVGVQGTYETFNKESLIARFVGYEVAFRHDGMKRLDSVDFLGTFSVAYLRQAFLDEGGFDTTFTDANAEDAEFSYRLRKKGFKLLFNPNAIVAHIHPSKLGSYLRGQFFRAYWRIPMYLRHKDKPVGDSYTGRDLFYQSILALLTYVSIPLLKPQVTVILLALLFVFNLPFGLFSYKLEKKFLILSPLLASVRSLVGVLGALWGVLFFCILSPLRRCAS